MGSMQSKVILIADDEPDDAFIVETMLKRAALPHKLHHVKNGAEAIEWLAGKGKYEDRDSYPVPDLLLLDLVMPLKSGFEVLNWLQTRKEFQQLRIAIVSSCEDQATLCRLRKAGATTYFAKSPRFLDLIEYIRSNL